MNCKVLDVGCSLVADYREAAARLGEMERAYHMWPSFDRPVEGCRNCAVVARLQNALLQDRKES